MHASLARADVFYEHEALGTLAITRLPEGYEGSCLLEFEGRTTQRAVLPSVAQALTTARWAVGELGGYRRVTVSANDAGAPVTHQTWEDWLFA